MRLTELQEAQYAGNTFIVEILSRLYLLETLEAGDAEYFAFASDLQEQLLEKASPNQQKRAKELANVNYEEMMREAE